MVLPADIPSVDTGTEIIIDVLFSSVFERSNEVAKASFPVVEETCTNRHWYVGELLASEVPILKLEILFITLSLLHFFIMYVFGNVYRNATAAVVSVAEYIWFAITLEGMEGLLPFLSYSLKSASL